MDYPLDPMPDLNQQPQHLRSPRSRRTLKLNKKVFLIVGIVAAVLVLGVGTFFFLSKDKKQDSTAQNQTAQQQAAQEDDEPKLPPAEAAQAQVYKSETLKIEITHRKDWTIKEEADKKLITLTSPKFTFQTGNESKKDVFTLKIGFGATKEAQKNIDSAKAVRDSLLIGYDAPTEAQRHYTNISYAGPAGESSDLFEFFIVTGSVAFKKDVPLNGGVVINSGDFLIAGGFGADAQNQLKFEPVPAPELEQYAAFEQAVAIVKSLKVY